VAEPVIAEAWFAAGHDGEAVLVVRVTHDNGGTDSVTLDSVCAQKLMEDCKAEKPENLVGQPWHRLLAVLDPK